MTTPLTLETLKDRWQADAAGDPGAGGGRVVAERRLAAALTRVGWRAASDEPASEVARELGYILDACLRGHRDLPTLRRDLARSLRAHAHALDGSGTDVASWEPTAWQVLASYVRESPPSTLDAGES